jgi:hypothetical protein
LEFKVDSIAITLCLLTVYCIALFFYIWIGMQNQNIWRNNPLLAWAAGLLMNLSTNFWEPLQRAAWRRALAYPRIIWRYLWKLRLAWSLVHCQQLQVFSQILLWFRCMFFLLLYYRDFFVNSFTVPSISRTADGWYFRANQGGLKLHDWSCISDCNSGYATLSLWFTQYRPRHFLWLLCRVGFNLPYIGIVAIGSLLQWWLLLPKILLGTPLE